MGNNATGGYANVSILKELAGAAAVTSRSTGTKFLCLEPGSLLNVGEVTGVAVDGEHSSGRTSSSISPPSFVPSPSHTPSPPPTPASSAFLSKALWEFSSRRIPRNEKKLLTQRGKSLLGRTNTECNQRQLQLSNTYTHARTHVWIFIVIFSVLDVLALLVLALAPGGRRWVKAATLEGVRPLC